MEAEQKSSSERDFSKTPKWMTEYFSEDDRQEAFLFLKLIRTTYDKFREMIFYNIFFFYLKIINGSEHIIDRN